MLSSALARLALQCWTRPGTFQNLRGLNCLSTTQSLGVLSGCEYGDGHTTTSGWGLWSAVAFAGTVGTCAARAEELGSPGTGPGTSKHDLEPQPSSTGWNLISFETKQRVYFKYEKRIRDLSSPEKVFEYFSSHHKDGEKFMVATDLLRSVVATYPPQGSSMERAGSLPGERTPNLDHAIVVDTVFQQLDVDADGLLSFPEYLLLITLLSIPIADIQAVFDVLDMDGSGDVDFDEFKTIVHLLQAKATHHRAKTSTNLLSDSIKPGGLFVAFFGENQKGKLRVKQLLQFLLALHDEMVRLEFAHYDWRGLGYITGIDFARSLVVAADIRTVDRLLAKVDALDTSLAAVHIGFEDFASIARMRSSIDRLTVGLDFCTQVGRKVSRQDFPTLIKKLSDIQLSPSVVDVIFEVYGLPDGSLDVKVFLDVMKRREWMDGKQLLLRRPA